MSNKLLHPESQWRIQSRSKASLDDFDRQTIQSKIMINLGTNPFMDTIQSPNYSYNNTPCNSLFNLFKKKSCSSIQEYLSHNEDTITQKYVENNRQQVPLNGAKQYQGAQFLKPPSIQYKSHQQPKAAGPPQKKNLKNLLNKSEKQAQNSEDDFTQQDSITDENPNIEVKVLELNNNQTGNFTKFESLKKKNEKSQQEMTQSSNGNITTIRKAPFTTQETGQYTQTTQVFLNSPTMHTNDKMYTPNSYLSHQDDIKEIPVNGQTPFQLESKSINTNNIEKGGVNYQRNNFTSVDVANQIGKQQQGQQIYNQIINFNTFGGGEQNKLDNYQFNGVNQIQNQVIKNTNSSSQFIVQPYSSYQNINGYPQIQIDMINSQKQISSQTHLVNSPVASSSQMNQYLGKNSQLEEQYQNLSSFKSPSSKLGKLDYNIMNSVEQQQYPNQEQINQDQLLRSFQLGSVQQNEFPSSPIKQIGHNGFIIEGGKVNNNSPIHMQSNNLSCFNNSLLISQNNNNNQINIKQTASPSCIDSSNNMFQSMNYQQIAQMNTQINPSQPFYNASYYQHNIGQKRSQSNGNISSQIIPQDQSNQKLNDLSTQQNQQNLDQYLIKNNFSKNPPFLIQQQVNGVRYQNLLDGKINSVSYQQLNQNKNQEKSPNIMSQNVLNNNSNVYTAEVLSSNNLKETINLNIGTQLNLQQYTKDIIPISNTRIISPPKVNNKEPVKQTKEFQYPTSSSSLQSGGGKSLPNNISNNNSIQQSNGINLCSVQSKPGIVREKENPITRLRNKSQPIAQRSPVHAFTPHAPQIPLKKKEETPTNKGSTNFKNMISSLLYNEEDKIKKASHTTQLSPKVNDIKNDHLYSTSNSSNANPILGDISPLNSLTTNMSINLTNSIPVGQSIPISQALNCKENNIALVKYNINSYYSQTASKSPSHNQNPQNIATFLSASKGVNNISQPRIINQGKGEPQRDRISPFSKDQSKEKNTRSQSCQREANTSFIDKSNSKVNNGNYSKVQPTPTKQRVVSQYTPQVKALQNNNSQNQFPQGSMMQQSNVNANYNENKMYSTHITEKKFQQPESPIKSAEPYSPFNTNRNSQSFQYDLTSMKNAQSSLNVLQPQPLTQAQLQYQQQLNKYGENIPSTQQTPIKSGQALQQLPLSQIDKNSQILSKQVDINGYCFMQNNQRQQNYQTLLNTTKVLNDQSLNTKKITSQQIDKKGKTSSAADQNIQKKELPKNAITVMRIHQKSFSISGNLYGGGGGSKFISQNSHPIK